MRRLVPHSETAAAADVGDVLIVDPEGEWYAQRLARAAPDAPVRWACSFADAEADLAQVRAVITTGIPAMGSQLSADAVAHMPRLEWVQCLLAGHEHLRGALDARPDVVLTTTRGVHGPQMAELVLLHMLVLARGVKQQIANQTARVWRPWPQPLLSGRVVGVVGLGASGRHVARTCAALGMTVYGVSRTAGAVEGVDHVFTRAQLTEVAAQVDFLVLVLAAEPESEKLVDASVLEAMKPSAYLINIARGSVVDEQALIATLRAGTIAGAGLDVFTVEPPPPDSPLWELDSVFLTPHVGGFSDRFQEQNLAVVEPNLRSFVSGRPQDLVNAVAR
ncbi:MAG: D-2-hydroxyacid dehydrogenase [Solirubrobacteraceae bacterium]